MSQMCSVVLLIQFRLSTAAAQMEYDSIVRALGSTVVVRTVSALQPMLLWEQPATLLAEVAGVILGGSGDFDFDGSRECDDPVCVESRLLVERLAPLLAHIFTTNLPLFGICYGHQLVGAWQGVTVHHDPTQCKTRTHTVCLTAAGQAHPLLATTPSTFTVQYGHKDVLAAVPPGATLLAVGGEACQVPAVAYSDCIITTQFHPELTLADLHKRVAVLPGYLPAGVAVGELFTDTPHAPTLLARFGQWCGRRDERG